MKTHSEKFNEAIKEVALFVDSGSPTGRSAAFVHALRMLLDAHYDIRKSQDREQLLDTFGDRT